MARFAAFLLALLASGIGSSSASGSVVKSFNALSVSQRLAVEESERRLIIYDRALQQVEIAWKHKKITQQEFDYETRDLTAFIGEEARYQNEILIKKFIFPEDAREVLENIAKYAIEIPACIVLVAVGAIGKADISFSP
jgi:hypothetical protein